MMSPENQLVVRNARVVPGQLHPDIGEAIEMRLRVRVQFIVMMDVEDDLETVFVCFLDDVIDAREKGWFDFIGRPIVGVGGPLHRQADDGETGICDKL
jgi:hypothetical protein